ncbi:L-methionine/branched-chain amino acid transporter [Anaerosinus sp.]|uniref:L-methionine/branched-chain amino acid transporter n=1 Tax=Selenobaculum sp. TaxID=3074374 RepID=UPI0015AEE7EC
MSNLKKTLNLYQGIGILVSTLLGSSIFIIPAVAATIAGVYSIIAWVVTILFMIPIAFTFSNLGSFYPHAGGTAFFVKQALGDCFENFTSWLYLAVMPIGPPVVIITGANYIGAVVQANDMEVFFICVGMVVAMFLMNLMGLKFAGSIQSIISIIIVGILLGIIVLALGKQSELFFDFVNFNITANVDTMLNISRAITIVFWCFVGLEAIVHLSSEFKDIKKDFPKTIFISMAIVGGLCVLISLIVLKYKAYGTEQIDANYMVFLLKYLLGNSSVIFIGIIGFFSCFTTVNLYILSFSRMIYSMGESGIISSFFSKVTNRGIPLNALVPCYLCVLATIVLKYSVGIKLESLILYANGIFVALYLLASISGVFLLSGIKRFLAITSTIFCMFIYFSLGYQILYSLVIIILAFFYDATRKKYKAVNLVDD